MNGSNSGTSGETVATVDFTKKDGNDSVSDKVLAEIVRRLQVTFEGGSSSDIDGSAAAPSDKTVIWWPKDPTSGTRIGQPQRYDNASNSWVPLTGNVVTPVVMPQVVTGVKTIAAGASVVNFDFTPIKSQSKNYSVTVTPSTWDGSAWNATPANMNNFGWILTNRANNQFTVSFFAVPTGGISVEWRIEEILP